jgi:hypothetical protein
LRRYTQALERRLVRGLLRPFVLILLREPEPGFEQPALGGIDLRGVLVRFELEQRVAR